MKTCCGSHLALSNLVALFITLKYKAAVTIEEAISNPSVTVINSSSLPSLRVLFISK